MFSVIIATRDRPELLSHALRSVAAQSYRDIEVLLVDDSSTGALRDRNAALLAELAPGSEIVTAAGFGGSGPGEARNRGMARAARPYLAFLDDDDEWIDPHYLARAASAVERLGLDLHFGDQEARRADGTTVSGPVWAEDLAVKLPASGAQAMEGTFVLSPQQVLLSDGFAHLNTTVVRRSLAWDRLGGFDPGIRYEEDRDFYLRAIDAAGAIGYTPGVVARHHVPSARTSASSIATEQKEACRLAVLDKAAAHSRQAPVRARARRDRAYALKAMSLREAAAGDLAAALRHGRAALRDQVSAKWLAFLATLYVRSAFSRRSQAG
ncbi:MAG: glycosyltransferase [Acetobacteraceae bacterium]|nr:glycosyltransferase [Acetobacteraceae bacterium]